MIDFMTEKYVQVMNNNMTEAQLLTNISIELNKIGNIKTFEAWTRVNT